MVLQPDSSADYSRITKLVFRLGWLSFVLGACAFLIHYISIDHLDNISPINAGLISGFFLMIAGLASVAAGHRETSSPYFFHAHIWSFLVNIIIAPGLIAVSVTALILDNHDLQPICEPSLSSSRTILFGNSFEIYPSNIPCLKTTNLFHLTQTLNAIQLIIGVICFCIHMVLLSYQRKIIKQLKTNEIENKHMVYPPSAMIDMSI